MKYEYVSPLGMLDAKHADTVLGAIDVLPQNGSTTFGPLTDNHGPRLGRYISHSQGLLHSSPIQPITNILLKRKTS